MAAEKELARREAEKREMEEREAKLREEEEAQRQKEEAQKREEAAKVAHLVFGNKVAEADSLFREGRHLEAVAIYRELKQRVESEESYVNPDGTKVTRDSDEWLQLSASEQFLFLTEMIEIYDGFQ